MKPLKSTGKEQIVVAVTVLKLVLNDFMRWGMKAAVLYDYPDLIGISEFEQIEEEDVMLLERAGNPRTELLLIYTNVFRSWLVDFFNLFGPVFQNTMIDQDTFTVARDIYLNLIYENPSYRAEDLDIDLELFAYSVMHIMYCLCEFVIIGKLDLDGAFDQGSSYDQVMDGTWEVYVDHHDPDYRLVANLMEIAVKFYNELTDFLMGDK